MKDVSELSKLLTMEIAALDAVDPDYLNEAGQFHLDALKKVLYLTSFVDSLDTLKNLEQFQELSSLPSRHPEYYKTIRMINRLLE